MALPIGGAMANNYRGSMTIDLGITGNDPGTMVYNWRGSQTAELQSPAAPSAPASGTPNLMMMGMG